MLFALIMFGITAAGGLTAASFHLRHQPPPAWLGRVHGALALASIIVLGVAAGRASGTDWKRTAFAGGALAMFFIAAVLGRVLFSYHLRTGNVPRGLIAVHAGAAVTGVVLVILQLVANAG